MISLVNQKFRDFFKILPKRIQVLAIKNYDLWKNNPSLRFKQITKGVYSIRIGATYRALGLKTENKIIWFWIGHHSNYDKILIHLNKK